MPFLHYFLPLYFCFNSSQPVTFTKVIKLSLSSVNLVGYCLCCCLLVCISSSLSDSVTHYLSERCYHPPPPTWSLSLNDTAHNTTNLLGWPLCTATCFLQFAKFKVEFGSPCEVHDKRIVGFYGTGSPPTFITQLKTTPFCVSVSCVYNCCPYKGCKGELYQNQKQRKGNVSDSDNKRLNKPGQIS